jgi:hypothetical protein
MIVEERGSPSALIYIKPTIHKALLALRFKHRVRRVWIDAVCINQLDSGEKSIQVRNMSTVYRLALRVLIWLPVENPARTASIIKNTRTVDEMKKVMLRRSAGRDELVSLLLCPWFGRRWIIQEVSLAPRADIVLTGHQVDWADFCRLVRLVHEYHENTWDKPSSDLDWTVTRDTLAFYESTAYDLVQLVSQLRSPGDGTTFSPFRQLEDVLSHCNRFECQMGHDTVYALLPLGKDVLSLDRHTGCVLSTNINVDYSKTTLDVYKDFMQFSHPQRRRPHRCATAVLGPA